MKLCFSTLGCPEMSFDEVLAFANRFDISVLEVRGIEGVVDNDQILEFSPERTEETKAKFARAGICPWILGTSCSFHDEKCYESGIREGKTAIEIAQRIGFRAIRVFGDLLRDPEKEAEAIALAAKGIASLCDEARGTGVDVFLEVHGDFNSAARLMPVVDACKDKGNFGLIWDIITTHGVYGDRWVEFYDIFAPYIRHIHLKDAVDHQPVLPGDGELPVLPVVKHLCNQGYDGYFSLEWERKWHPELAELEQPLSRLKDLLKDYLS